MILLSVLDIFFFITGFPVDEITPSHKELGRKELVMKLRPANFKGKNKDDKIMLEGPRPCTIFCFVLTHFG